MTEELAEAMRARNSYEADGAEILAKKHKSEKKPEPKGLLSHKQAKRLLKVVEAK